MSERLLVHKALALQSFMSYFVILTEYVLALKHSLIILNLENADFIEAFDAYTSDLNITDASDEAQCEQVREFLGFDPGYIDDYEVCGEFYDIKCDYEKGNVDTSFFEEKRKGGTIPDFKGLNSSPPASMVSSLVTADLLVLNLKASSLRPALLFKRFNWKNSLKTKNVRLVLLS